MFTAKSSPLAVSALAIALASLAVAGEVRITVRGTVANASPPPSQGPFAGVAFGDPVTLSYEVFVPGMVITPNQAERYTLDPLGSTLTIGLASAGLSGSVNVYNAFPVADSVRLGGAPLVGGGTITCELSEQTGALLSSTDLTQNLGTWPVSVFGSYNFVLIGNGGFVELQPTELVIELADIGASYCSPAVPNSTGAPGEILALGSESIATNNITLSASHLPTNAFGFFLASRMQGMISPGAGSQGILCLSGSIGRYVGPGQIQNTGALGSFELAIDVLTLPTPTGPVAALPGETWNFQAWHRDSVNGTATSNFTDGVSLTFQ
ncbi:MAG: hypothetical protein R3F49_11175 [Planctomycetota bacterium]